MVMGAITCLIGLAMAVTTAPRARRRVDVCPLRLRRAVELRGGVGDPPRLRDRDGDRDRLDRPLPGGVLGPPRRQAGGVADRLAGAGARGPGEHPRRIVAAP